jgi:hypothetical protein
MQPEVTTGETTSFPSTISALTDDAPHMQGSWSRLAPVACADLNASTAASATMTTLTPMTDRGPQNHTTRGCRAVIPSAMGRVTHLSPRQVLVDAPGTYERPAYLRSRAGAGFDVLPWFDLMECRQADAALDEPDGAVLDGDGYTAARAPDSKRRPSTLSMMPYSFASSAVMK